MHRARRPARASPSAARARASLSGLVRTSRKGVFVRTRVPSFESFGSFCLFFAVFALAENARSADEAVSAASPVRLVWEAKPGTETCLSAAELERLVEVELEHSVFGANEVSATRIIRVRLERDAARGGFRALVASEPAEPNPGAPPAPPGVVRELSGVRCRDLDEPLALVVALLADEEGESTASAVVDEEALPDPEPVPTAKEDVQPLGPVTTAPRWEASQNDARWSYEGDLAFATGFGVLPNVGAGAELGLLAEPPSFPSLRLRGVGLISAPAEPAPGATVSFAYAIAGLALCPQLVRFGHSSVRLCVGADLGALHAESRGLEESRETTELFGQAELTLRAAHAFGAGWLGTLSLGATFPTQIDRYVYRQDGKTTELFQMAFVPILATAGVAYEIL